MNTTARFDIECISFLDDDGQVKGRLPPGAPAADALVDMYRLMVLTRAFDHKAIALQRTGLLGTYASCLGQEAIGAATGTAMRAEDVLLPTYREQAAQFARGVKMSELLLYWGGDERGSNFQAAPEDFPVCVPIGTQTCHAVGVATAFRIRGQARVAVCMAGDGATSRGDFYESINLAGVWRLPVVFVVSNNQWAISVPVSAQTACRSIAQKAIAGGFAGVQVDGNDAIATRFVVEKAIDKARAGGGPTLIEALTYRLGDHTTADDAGRYREDAEVSAQWKHEPIARLRAYLAAERLWSKRDEETLLAECQGQVSDAAEAYLSVDLDAPQAMFDHLYARLPTALADQRRHLIEAHGAEREAGDGND